MKYNVKNCPLSIFQGANSAPYVVIRVCEGAEYWYYGSYNDLTTAFNVAKEIGNGIPVETCNVNRI